VEREQPVQTEMRPDYEAEQGFLLTFREMTVRGRELFEPTLGVAERRAGVHL
jgi:hypothetical protein